MGGAVALPLVVEVAFGEQPLDTGTLTWTDISDYVKRGPGVDFLRGWDTETGEPIAGRLSFTVNNDDGDFTPGETGAFGEIRNRLPVRVSAVIGTATGNALTYDEGVGWYDMLGATYDDAEIGTVVLWTGLVESWRQSWEGGVRSQVAVTCVDRWAAIRRLKFKDPLAVVMASQAPDHLIPFTDVSGSARGAATVGVDFTPKEAPSPLSFASAANPQAAGLPVVTAASEATASNGDGWAPGGAASIAWTMSAWLCVPVSGSALINMTDGDLVSGQIAQISLSSSNVTATVIRQGVGAASITSSAARTGWHMVTLTASVSGAGAVTLTCYVDGASVGSDTTTFTTGGLPRVSTLLIGRGASGMAYFGVWDRALSAAEILQQYQAGASAGVAGETADTRAARLLTFIDPPPSLSTTGTFTSTMSKQDLTDKSLGDALLECATAERGTIYVSRDGWPVLTSRSWRVATAVAFTIPAKALAADVTFTLDDQQLTNSATVDRMVGEDVAGSTTARNETSVATYGEQNKSLQVWVDTDAQLLERANAEANIDAVAQPRSSDLMVDILTKSATISASTLLGADIGQRIAVSGMPSTAPGGDEFYIDSISDKVTASGWERTFTVSPRADYFTIADATYGQLDNVFVLAF